jgi:hypothetical protein
MALPMEVVVLDDISRFAGHVWQYLASGLGFGIGNMADDGNARGAANEPLKFVETRPLPIPSGAAQVRWINAGLEQWDEKLEVILDDIAGRPACFLIDVRGPIHVGQARYDWEKAIRKVKARAWSDEVQIFLVSSYRTGFLRSGGESILIHTKTSGTIEQIARKLRTRDGKLEGLHVLVTGAGFELKSDLGGAHGLGMPFTQDLLRNGWERCGYGGSFDKSKYPIPSRLTVGQKRKDLKPLRAAAAKPDLDAYWDEALNLVLASACLGCGKPESREQKIAASLEEHKVREAFRQAFLNHDWGYLNQALDAASLDWVAWLSTNYTGFADRALMLMQRYGKTSKHWSIVSTSNESIQLIRNILHGDKQEPVLFKLHGHIEHLLTMAVAGQDKELYSTLSLPVDTLHEVYTAAELFLKRRLESGRRVVWHVVGHGLGDALLVDLMRRVCRSHLRDHRFLFVGPDMTPAVERERRDLFSALGLAESRFVGVPLCADEYLARLRRFGLSAKDCKDLGAWRDRLVSLPHR